MGQLDQFAKQIFAEETELVTGGAAVWQMPPEIRLSEVRLDGLLIVRNAARLPGLASPWPQAAQADEVVLEIKMQGDHTDMNAVRRALLRRQAREVQRAENPKVPWDGDESLWIVASNVPAELARRRTLRPIAPGCFQVEPSAFPFLWIAANELPLVDELVPFLIARSGRALDDFSRWVRTRRSPDWLLRMVQILPMSLPARDDLLRALLPIPDDPELRERRDDVIRSLLRMTPKVENEVFQRGENEGRLIEARSVLRRVLARRNLAVSAEDGSRIEACTDLATLERWLDQAIDAQTVAEALQ